MARFAGKSRTSINGEILSSTNPRGDTLHFERNRCYITNGNIKIYLISKTVYSYWYRQLFLRFAILAVFSFEQYYCPAQRIRNDISTNSPTCYPPYWPFFTKEPLIRQISGTYLQVYKKVQLVCDSL